MIFFFGIGVFIFDQIFKSVFQKFFPSWTILGMNSLVGGKSALVLSIVFLILLSGLFLRDKKIIAPRLLPSLGFGFCFGGAISNIIDRIARGGVLDIGGQYVKTNPADVFVFAGLLILLYFYFSRKEVEL